MKPSNYIPARDDSDNNNNEAFMIASPIRIEPEAGYLHLFNLAFVNLPFSVIYANLG